MIRPCNLWVITHEEFESFTYTGGKVIYICEAPELEYKNHPAIVTAGELLPTIESISAEINGNLEEAVRLYCEYLLGEEADRYINVIIAVAIQNIPVGIMFGRDERNFEFPKTFVNFLAYNYGIAVGTINSFQPGIDEEFLPYDYAKLYNAGMMDFDTFITTHPNMPIHPSAVYKMSVDVNPVVKVKDHDNYQVYFEQLRKAIYDNGGRILIDPLVAL